MIEYRKGDVLDLVNDERFIIHGANCFKTMGSGIARQIKEKYPEAYLADVRYSRSESLTRLGSYSYATIGNVTIVNAYTQYSFGSGKRHLNYEALYSSINSICRKWSDVKVMAMPKIGCGLGGGDWSIVEAMLTVLSDQHDKLFRIYEL